MADKKYIDWSIVKDWIESNWPPSDPNLRDEEVAEMAISIAGEIDAVIEQNIKEIIDCIRAKSIKTLLCHDKKEDEEALIIKDQDLLDIKHSIKESKITIEIEGGLVSSVTGLPAGYEYVVIDHDTDKHR